MPSAQSLTKIDSAATFADRIRKIGDDLIHVARDIAAALDVNPRLADELQALGINRGVVRRLERLGRGQIHPSLVFSTTPGGERLLSVPLSEQSLALQDGIEVLDPDEQSTRNIPVHELTAGQARQAITNGRIRTIAEQRTWIRDRKAIGAAALARTDYRIGKDFVVTTKPGKWSKQLILQWLTEMN
jgi:hypothetical protein